MTYMQLITQIAESTGYTKREVRALLRHTAKAILDALCSGQPVQWDAVGTFFNVPEGAHYVRNYKTGERYWTEPRRRVKFKACEGFRNEVRRSIKLFKDDQIIEQYLPKEDQQSKDGHKPR
jgi:nucleoid DNA-binding protein